MRPCLALSIVAQFLSMIAGALAVAGEPPAAPSVASVRTQAVDRSVRRVQAEPAEIRMPLGASVLSCSPLWDVPSDAISVIGGPSISLQMALYRTLTCNPDLNLLRLGNPTTPSAESVEVARHFPTTLNPTLWIDYRPMILIPFEAFGPQEPLEQGPFIIGGNSTSTCPSASRSSWDIRPRTAITSPRQPTISSAGPSPRPSSWRWSRPTASFRRLSTGARSSRSPRSSPSSTRRSSHHCRTALKPTWSPRLTSSLPGSRAGRHGSWQRPLNKTTSSLSPTCGTRSGLRIRPGRPSQAMSSHCPRAFHPSPNRSS